MNNQQYYIDSHLHVLGLGYIESMINLSKYESIREITTIQSNKEFIIGRGWHENDFCEKRQPNKNDLNKISLDKPVIFIRVCGHVLVVNDKAMEVANINNDTSQIEGGTFNVKTGVFTEDALQLIYKIIPKPNKEAIKEMFVIGSEILVNNNIYMCASDDFSTLPVPYELVLQAMQEVYQEGKMKVKIVEQINLPSKILLDEFIQKGYHTINEELYKMGPLKLLADGSLGGRTAYMREPYADDPSTVGIKVFTDEVFNELIYTADRNGMDVHIHAIGDGAIDQVLNGVEASLSKTNRMDHRHAIIHAQLANNEQIDRMVSLGVSAIVQPIFLNSDIPIIESRLGKDRMKETYLFKTMYNKGVKVGFSTDSPVEDVSPIDNIKVAMTRQSLKFPEYGVFLKNEQFTYEECMDCYINHNKWLLREE
jgi:hypothetical protein